MSNINVNNITPQSGDNVSVSGSLIVSGSITAKGNIILGDTTSDSVSLGAEISSSLVPDADNTYDLGSSAKKWKDLHIDGQANIDSLVASASVITNAYIGAIVGDAGASDAVTIYTASIGYLSSSLIPTNDNLFNLGSSTKQWKDLYIDGAAAIDSASIDTASIGNITSNLIPMPGATYALGTMANSWGSAHIHGLAHIHTASINRLQVVNYVSGNLIPDADSTYDLGSSTKEWKNLHVDGIGYIDFVSASNAHTISSNINTLNSSNTASFNVMSASKVIGDLTPMHDNASDLGSSTKEWRNLYIDGTANIDNADITSLEVGTISASALPTSKASTSPGQFYTLSGSQIPLSGSTAQLNLFSASLFVFQRE